MKLSVQVVLHADDDSEPVVREVFAVQRETLASDTVGPRLAEAKDLLAARSRKRWSNTRSAPRSPSRCHVRTAVGRGGTKTAG